MADKVNVTEKLGLNKFRVDEQNSHIEVNKEYSDKDEISRVVRVCPAAVYTPDDTGSFFFSYFGCLECGTCKVLSEGKVVKSWSYPSGSFGIEYRMG